AATALAVTREGWPGRLHGHPSQASYAIMCLSRRLAVLRRQVLGVDPAGLLDVTERIADRDPAMVLLHRVAGAVLDELVPVVEPADDPLLVVADVEGLLAAHPPRVLLDAVRQVFRQAPAYLVRRGSEAGAIHEAPDDRVPGRDHGVVGIPVVAVVHGPGLGLAVDLDLLRDPQMVTR